MLVVLNPPWKDIPNHPKAGQNAQIESCQSGANVQKLRKKIGPYNCKQNLSKWPTKMTSPPSTLPTQGILLVILLVLDKKDTLWTFYLFSMAIHNGHNLCSTSGWLKRNPRDCNSRCTAEYILWAPSAKSIPCGKRLLGRFKLCGWNFYWGWGFWTKSQVGEIFSFY